MKKVGNIIFWAVVVGMVLIAMYTFYNKNKSSADLGQKSGSQNEQTLKDIKPENKQDYREEPKDTNIEAPVAPEFELDTIDGKRVKLSDYKGKVVVLNFWTTWCKYCIEEMPDFMDLSREFEKAGDAVVLAINVQEGPDTVKDYLKGADLMGLTVLMDESGEVASTYGVNGYPNTFILNKDGTLHKYIPGKTNKETVLNFVNEIR